MSISYIIVQKRYHESVSPDPAVESRLLAVVDGTEYTKYSNMLSATTHHARSGQHSAVLVAAVTSRKARDRFARTDDQQHALCTVWNIYRYAKVVCIPLSPGTIRIHMEIAVITVISISNHLSAGSEFNQNVPNTGILRSSICTLT